MRTSAFWLLFLFLVLGGSSRALAQANVYGSNGITDDSGSAMPPGNFGAPAADAGAVYKPPWEGAETPSRPGPTPDQETVSSSLGNVYGKKKSDIWNPSYLSSDIRSQLDRSRSTRIGGDAVPSPATPNRAITGGFSSFLQGLAGGPDPSSNYGSGLEDILRQVMNNS